MRRRYSAKSPKYVRYGGKNQLFRRIRIGWYRMGNKWKIVIFGGAAAAVALVLLFTLGGNLFLPKAQPESLQADTPSAAAEVPSATPAPAPTATPQPTVAPTPTPDPTLKRGMESAEVTKLQERLMDLGYLDIDEPTLLFGPATEGAVRYFQRQHGLEMDGVCGPQTLALIYSEDAKRYTLLQGTEGGDVDMLQERLMELGYLSVANATGFYGDQTAEAVKTFQKNNDLGVDGKTGEYTLSLIYSADAKPSPEKAVQVARKGSIEKFIAAAEDQVGEPYVWGAAGPNSFDCSGLVTYCLREAGSTTGRLNAAGFSKNSKWESVKWDDLQRGDLVFYRARGTIGHVAIYIGNGMVIDASSSNGKVVKRDGTGSWFTRNFVNARRPW